MGNGPLLQGIGYGDATVLNANPAIQQMGRIIAQQKAEKDARDRELIKQLDALNKDRANIREKDKAEYINKANDWKQSWILANSLPKNSKERLDALAAAQTKYGDLLDYTGKNIEQKKHESELLSEWVKNGHLFDDASHQKFLKSLNSPMSSKDFIPFNQFSNFGRHVDPVKMSELLDGAKKRVLDNIIPERMRLPGVATSADKTGALYQNQKRVPYDKVAETYLHIASQSPDFNKYLHDVYGNIEGKDELSTRAARIHQLIIDRNEANGWRDADEPVFQANTADKSPSWLQSWNLMHYGNPNSPSTSQGNKFTPEQILIVGNPDGGNNSLGMLQGDNQAINRFLGLANRSQYGGKQPVFTIDPNTNEQVFKFPDQVTEDTKAKEENRILRARYAKNPSTKGGFLGIGAKDVPFEQSAEAKKLKPEFKVKKPGMEYRLNPNDPEGYVGQVGQMVKEQNMALNQLNPLLGKKKGGGQIPLERPNNAKKKLSKGSLNDL